MGIRLKKISVIVPVYNSIECLERCVKSICAQTYSNLEIILVDDGSTDGTDRLCELLALQDERIVVYHKANGGASSARNTGIRLASGEYLGFVDSDDYIEPYVYEEMIKAFAEAGTDRQGCAIVQISRDEVDEEGNRLPDVCVPPKQKRFCDTETFVKELLLHQGDCSFCTKLVKRELFQEHRFPEGVLNEDFRLLVEMLQEIDGIIILPQQGYHVVCRKDSTTRKKTKDSFSRVFLDIVDNADRMQELVNRKYPALYPYAVRFNLYQRLDYLLHVPISQMTGKNEFYRNVIKYLRRHAADSVRNPYLTGRQKVYLMLLTTAPKTVRRVHAKKMERRKASC
ncbi:MAG: glycosyltransferase family 2 protein [Lachnospiraceae bacterium]|nr:glycosyltransferase family 2 protein [Lachnospiraceae bacterium]